MSRGKPIEGFIYSADLAGRGLVLPERDGHSIRSTVGLGNSYAGHIGSPGPQSLTRAEWRDLMRQVIKSGGWIRREAGETFIHDRRGSLVAEAYALIPTPKVQS